MLRLLMKFARTERARLVKFAVVGGAGVVVNEGLTWFAHDLLFAHLSSAVQLNAAAILGTVVSIFTNFVLNDLWTWGDRAKGDGRAWLRRLLKYYLAAGLGVAVQFAVLNGLVALLGRPYYLWWNLAGIGCAMASNFVLMHWWAFRAP